MKRKLEMNKIKNYLKSLYDYRYLLKIMIKRDIQNKYKGSYLGILWSLFNPLLQMIVLTIIFSTLFARDIENFALYMISGRILFDFFSMTTTMSIRSLTGTASLVKKIYFPKYIITLSRVISNFIIFLISLLDLVLVIVLTKATISWYIIFIPIYLILFFVFTLGVSLILSTVAVFFRDIEHLYGIVVMILMYFSAIFYPVEILPIKYELLLKLNPLYQFILGFRSCIYYNNGILLDNFLSCLIWSILSIVAGIVLFKKNQDKFILYI